MKVSWFFISSFFFLCLSCSEQVKKEALVMSFKEPSCLIIPDLEVEKSSLFYDTERSLWTLNEELYSGYATSFYEDGTLKEKIGILKGRKQNESNSWFPDGHFKQTANYHLGKLDGEKKSWSSDTSHVLISHLNYHLGKAHGEQKKWYVTGEIFKIMNLNMGKEEGMQQAFRKNGDLFANYEAREGRIFGLKKSALCFGLEEEEVQSKK